MKYHTIISKADVVRKSVLNFYKIWKKISVTPIFSLSSHCISDFLRAEVCLVTIQNICILANTGLILKYREAEPYLMQKVVLDSKGDGYMTKNC